MKDFIDKTDTFYNKYAIVCDSYVNCHQIYIYSKNKTILGQNTNDFG